MFGHYIKCLRTYRGGEYMRDAFATYLKENGISSQRTAPYSPQQNSPSVEMARCMLIDAKMENSFI